MEIIPKANVRRIPERKLCARVVDVAARRWCLRKVIQQNECRESKKEVGSSVRTASSFPVLPVGWWICREQKGGEGAAIEDLLVRAQPQPPLTGVTATWQGSVHEAGGRRPRGWARMERGNWLGPLPTNPRLGRETQDAC